MHGACTARSSIDLTSILGLDQNTFHFHITKKENLCYQIEETLYDILEMNGSIFVVIIFRNL